MSMINKEIDDFTVQAFHNDDFETVTKDDVLGKWGVFFFYPADFTFVCPTELEDLGALYDKFQEANCEIYAVSCDTHFAHKAWHDASENIKKLPYPMLADPTHKLADIFDVYIEEEGVAERGSFVVNPEGKIVCYEVNAGNIGRNAAELLTQTEHLLLGKDHRFVNRVKIARRQFGQTREPFRNIGTGLLAALAATHAVAHHIHAVACAGAVLVVFPTQADIAVQTDLNMFDVHESRPFTPIFRKRIFRKWNTSASDSFARHLRNVGSEPSMNFRSSAMSCQ